MISVEYLAATTIPLLFASSTYRLYVCPELLNCDKLDDASTLIPFTAPCPTTIALETVVSSTSDSTFPSAFDSLRHTMHRLPWD